HREPRALAVLGRRGNVIGIPAHAKTNELGINARPPAPRMLELFQDDGTAAITEHEAVAILIPRAARLCWGIVAGGEGLRLAEAPEAADRGRHLAPTGDHHIGVTVLNRAHADADRVRRGRAGGHHP